MEITVYVDVLLLINYIVNVLLILCTVKISGVNSPGRKIVAAALVGSLSSLTIFLPFYGLLTELILKLVGSALIVRIAITWRGWRGYLRQWLTFFAVSFFFAGAMLGIYMFASPRGMMYYNGVVYFDISPVFLIAVTVMAYLILSLIGRISRNNRIQSGVFRVDIHRDGSVSVVKGLVDSGNSLREPFSGSPVIVCQLDSITAILPEQAVQAVRNGISAGNSETEFGLPIRLVPFRSVDDRGVLPAFAPDRIIVHTLSGGAHDVERVWVAISAKKIGNGDYNAILNPELAARGVSDGNRIKIHNGGGSR